MKVRTIAAFLISAVISLQGHAESLTLKKDSPEVYVVKQGDTLWDISGMYLDKPWRWPELWKKNRQIKNPHWIYPGDKLRLIWVSGHPYLEVEGGASSLSSSNQIGKKVIRLSPKMRSDEFIKPVPIVSYQEIAPYLRADAMIDSHTNIDQVPYVLGENSDQSTVMFEGQELHVKGKLESGKSYGVYRVGDVYKDPDTKEELARPLELVGTLTADGNYDQDLSKGILSTTYNAIFQGDRVMPLLEDSAINAYFEPKSGHLSAGGKVIDSPQKSTYVGRYDTVIVNKGSREQLHPGDVFDIVRPGAEVVDRGVNKVEYTDINTTAQRDAKTGSTHLQSDAVGELMIVKVYEKTSLAIILKSSAMVTAGYEIRDPQ